MASSNNQRFGIKYIFVLPPTPICDLWEQSQNVFLVFLYS